MATIRIAKGLKATYKNARGYTISQALLNLDKYTDNYEVLNDDLNRMYGDIDGKDIDLNEQEFWKKDDETKKSIIQFLKDEQYCLLTSTSFLHKKISWRFVIVNRKCSREDNKKWVEMSIQSIDLPEGITFDTSPYMSHQKMRMLGSNKDGENRPLKIVKGESIDTLISYIPDDCILMELPKEKKIKKTKKINVDVLDGAVLTRIVMNITNNEETTWEQWYRVAQAIYNEGGTEELFNAWSSKSLKHNEREAQLLWKGLKDREVDSKLTIGSLYYWSSQSNLTEHERIILETCPVESYQYQKILFEKTHFKLMNPPCYVRISEGKVNYLKEGDLTMLYQNLYCEGEVFVTKWKVDPAIRTYEQVVFAPKQSVPSNHYNIFTDFRVKAIQGDISIMNELMFLLSGKDEKVFEYIENYFAHLVQKPYEKPKVCLVFSTTKQGAGKDTPLDFIGKMLGNEYFFNTEDAENNVFGRFTGHLQKTLLLKMEEVEFETNKKNESALLSLITGEFRSYEGKGKDAITLNDYKRIVMTTNKSIPVNIPESDRRFVLVSSSEDRVGDREFWNHVYAELAKPELMSAYYYHLLTKDISKFDPKDRPFTNFYKEVKTALRPYHAIYFQTWIQNYGAQYEDIEMSSTEWLDKMNQGSKFTITATKFGRDIKSYPETAFSKKKSKYNNIYKLHTKEMYDFLIEKGWWIDI
jgi:hypothetical protein